jgi:hypothetical protein
VDILHLKNLVIQPAENRPCAVRPVGGQRCNQPCAVDFEYTLDGKRWGIALCANCFKLAIVPYLPPITDDGIPLAALLAKIEGGLQ